MEDFPVYGQTRYNNQYILEEYPWDEMKFDMNQIRIFTLDIETGAENGFPDIETADQEILLISPEGLSHWSYHCVWFSPLRGDRP